MTSIVLTSNIKLSLSYLFWDNFKNVRYLDHKQLQSMRLIKYRFA